MRDDAPWESERGENVCVKLELELADFDDFQDGNLSCRILQSSQLSRNVSNAKIVYLLRSEVVEFGKRPLT
jgi:hypothetical protein